MTDSVEDPPKLLGEINTNGREALVFEDLMGLAAEPTLQKIIGQQGVQLLSKLDPNLVQPSKLRQVALGLKSPQQLLLERETRNELLTLLPAHEAEALAQRLGVMEGDPYTDLEEMRVSRTSARYAELLDFFGLSAPEPEVKAEITSLVEVDPSYGLFSHQRVASEQVLANIELDPHRTILHMPTGSGKTRTAMHVIASLLNRHDRAQVVWLAHSQELCEQAFEEFSRAWMSLGNRRIVAQRWWGDHELDTERLGDGVVVAGLAKCYSSAAQSTDTIGRLAGSANLVVIDEAHQAVAPSYQHVIDMLTLSGEASALLGLTATPGRSWDDIAEDEKLIDFFNSKKVTLEIPGFDSPIDYLTENGYLANPTYESLNSNAGLDLSARDLRDLEEELDIPTRILEKLAQDDQRNLAVLNRIERALRRHSRVIVFATTVEHAKLLTIVLQARENDAQVVTGDTPSAERGRNINWFKERSDDPKVLVNFGVLTTGFDAPRTSCAIIARPTKSLVLYSQMVGRATRGTRAGGNEACEIVTVVDTALPGFRSMTEAFENWEKEWSPE